MLDGWFLWDNLEKFPQKTWGEGHGIIINSQRFASTPWKNNMEQTQSHGGLIQMNFPFQLGDLLLVPAVNFQRCMGIFLRIAK